MVLLDVGGVINEKHQQTAQFQHLVGAFFASQLGGTPEAWAELINVFKQGPAYYERIFADLGIRPAEALVVDDSPLAIGWATQTGARTILVSSSSHPEKGSVPHIGSLAELPAFLQQRGSQDEE